jgi:hypothetical protein
MSSVPSAQALASPRNRGRSRRSDALQSIRHGDEPLTRGAPNEANDTWFIAPRLWTRVGPGRA